jgi:hypothetical protein
MARNFYICPQVIHSLFNMLATQLRSRQITGIDITLLSHLAASPNTTGHFSTETPEWVQCFFVSNGPPDIGFAFRIKAFICIDFEFAQRSSTKIFA